MVKDAVYEGKREVKTFADLATGADVLIKKSEKEKRGSYYTIMSSLLLTAFTFEAYLNYLGSEIIKFWDEIESIKVMQKYKVLCKELNLIPDFSRRPYQTLSLLFRFRNAIAHGRSEILKEIKDVNSDDDPHRHAPKTKWEEYCKLENAKKAKEDVSEVIRELNKKAGLGEYPFIRGMTIASVSLKKN